VRCSRPSRQQLVQVGFGLEEAVLLAQLLASSGWASAYARDSAVASRNFFTTSGFCFSYCCEVKYIATVRSGAMSTRGEAISTPPWLLIVAVAGSTTHAASICPLSRAAGIWSKGSSTSFTLSGSPPAVRTAARTAVSLMFLSVLMATFLPSRSLGDLMALPFFTMRPLKSLPCTPVEAIPLTTALTGTLLVWATINDVTLLKPNWNWPLTTPGTIAAPPCAVEMVSFRPCFS
jgi:hypothetical protein